MDKTNSFMKASGRYIMEPSLFIHTWNCSSSKEEVVNKTRQYWLQYANENILEPGKDGEIKEPSMTIVSIGTRAYHFRRKGLFMKKHPNKKKRSPPRYDWKKLRELSKQYEKKAVPPRESSPSKGFFSR